MDRMMTIPEIIKRDAEIFSGKTFVSDPIGSLTFDEIYGLAKRYGNFIRKEIGGNKSEVRPIAIYSDKSSRLLTMMFASLFAGGFYVVIDPEQPGERINKILDVLKPAALIFEDSLRDKTEEISFEGKKISFFEIEKGADESDEECPGLSVIKPDSPLYGIFTSGSTGIPKCVLISHRDVVDFIGHFSRIFSFSENDIIGNQAPFDFDVSVKDIYTSLFTGARLILIPREYFSMPAKLIDYLIDNHVTSLTWAVSAVCIISGMKGFKYKIPTEIRRVMFSGEVMPIKQLRIWQENLPDAMYVNLYGPTEITCNCTYYKIPGKYEKDDPLPLGIPFPGREVTIRDSDGNILTSPGSEGEICVSGESLAIGYFRDPEKTAAAFSDMKDKNGQPARTYHTGDMAVIEDDGTIRFAGRSDFQIKHMGHRIELEEIERDIMQIQGVERCALIFDDKKKIISSYYTGDIGKKDLHIRLKKLLPVYMVPNRFNHIYSMPLTKNGKIDRRRLPFEKTIE